MMLVYHPCPGWRVPADPNVTQDAARLEQEAQARGVPRADYVAGRLAYRWPDGTPAYTEAAAVANGTAAEVPAAPEAPAAAAGPRRKKP